MTETVMKTKALPEILFDLIKTEDVRLKEDNGIVQLFPVKTKKPSALGLRGMLADCPELSSYKHSEDKQLEKELDL